MVDDVVVVVIVVDVLTDLLMHKQHTDVVENVRIVEYRRTN